MRYALDVPAGFTTWPPELVWTSLAYSGPGATNSAGPKLLGGQRRTMGERSDELPAEAWREITVAQGSQGPRGYLFSTQAGAADSRRKSGEIHWAVYRRTWTAASPYYLSNAPGDTPLETWRTWGGFKVAH